MGNTAFYDFCGFDYKSASGMESLDSHFPTRFPWVGLYCIGVDELTQELAGVDHISSIVSFYTFCKFSAVSAQKCKAT